MVTVWPPTGELAVGADRLPGVVGGAAAALWLIVKPVPATVNVAVRAAPVLAATVKVTVPLPDPPADTVTKVAELVAVQVQPVPAVTGTDPVPPAALNDELVMAPAVTVHDGVVVDVLLLLSEQAADTSNNADTIQTRAYAGMRHLIHQGPRRRRRFSVRGDGAGSTRWLIDRTRAIRRRREGREIGQGCRSGG